MSRVVVEWSGVEREWRRVLVGFHDQLEKQRRDDLAENLRDLGIWR